MSLMALAWTLRDQDRADRLLALTGLTPQMLRDGVDDPVVLVAVCDFLAAYEADLVAAASELDIAPERIVAAREALA